MANILITGALGFVGRALITRLRADGHRLSGTTRDAARRAGAQDIPRHRVPPFDGDVDCSGIVAGADMVIHLAARVHVMKERASDPLTLFRQANRDGTRALAQASAEAGVKRFIFVSTVKVLGEVSSQGPLTDTTAPAPQDAYGISKLEGEQALAVIAAGSDMEAVILRPPLVHGPGVGGNLATLLGALRRGIPLPFGVIQNRRSLIHVDNLADAIAACLTHPGAAGECFLVSDGEAVSTARLMTQLAEGLGKRPNLWNWPPGLLTLLGRLTGKSGEIDRLIGSLEVDCSRFRQTLVWSPLVSLDEGLAETAAWYAANRSN